MYQGGFPPINTYPRVPDFRTRIPFHYQKENFQRHPQNYDFEFYCETCDRSFGTNDLLEKHKNQHQKCNIDGCQFIAHPKVITKHIQMQHASGIYKKIAKLNNPEEIKKWREERKKKYPTKINIDKKEAELKEKIERGEKLGLKYDGHNRKYKPGDKKRKPSFISQNQQQKRYKPNIQNRAPTHNNNKRPTIFKKSFDSSIEDKNNFRKLQPFAGIQDIMIECAEDQIEQVECNYEINDEDLDVDKPTEPSNSVPIVCSALSSLMCNYISSEDEIDESNTKIMDAKKNENFKLEPKIFTEKKTIQSVEATDAIQKGIINENSGDESGPEEVKIIRDVESDIINTKDSIVPKNTSKTVKNDNRHSSTIKKQYFKNLKHKVPSTLLQKLLHREIQQERNIVLQCIRHIVKSNFFDNTIDKI